MGHRLFTENLSHEATHDGLRDEAGECSVARRPRSTATAARLAA